MSLCRWGVGNEMAVVVQNEFGKFEARSLAFDSVPGCLTTPLYHAGWGELHAVSLGQTSMLDVSRRLRSVLERQVKAIPPSNRLWTTTGREVASCWRVLEIQLLEREGNVRNLVVDWANDFREDDEEEEGDLFHRGVGLLLSGKGQEAGGLFQQLIPSMGPRMQRFFQILAEVSFTLPMHSNKAEDWQRWQSSLGKLEDCLPKEDETLVHVCDLLKGDVSALVRHFQSSKSPNSWPQLLAAILIFKAPTANRAVLADLADRCVEPFNRTKRLDASRVAFRGDATKAIERLHDLESWSECHMALVFCSQTHPELFQTLAIKFALQLGLGPGRVETRPVNADVASLALSLEYLRYCSAPAQYFDLVLESTNVLASEGFAKRVFGLAQEFGLVEQQQRIARIQVLKWLRLGAVQTALRWTRQDVELEQLVLDRVLGDFANIELQDEVIGSENLPSETRRTINKLLQAQRDLLGSMGVLLECIEFLLPMHQRLVLLYAVLVDQQAYKYCNSLQCLQALRIVHSLPPSPSNHHQQQLLGLMTHQLAVLAKEGKI
ncbi:hypothetical protein BASA81_006108 [Batrachochytrium salamandrivorans]|nr:hypothetical protein BASA81_006108 [Batrachochytrium salamandrivorans]